MNHITFTRKPMPQLANYRPLFRISKILFVLNFSSRSGKSSLMRLHLFDWAMKKPQRMKLIEQFVLEHDTMIDRWGIDPSLNFALTIATEESLVVRDNGNYKITSKGMQLAIAVANESLLSQELNFLKGVGKKLSEKKILSAIEKWSEHAKN